MQSDNQHSKMYEGEEPYIFISYSHRDKAQMAEVTQLFKDRHIRFWYDSGLLSGDDWNTVIAGHLEKAAVCLLLLSNDAASSRYIKNELNFAISHRIPINILLIEQFVLPIDIEMMLGRIQMIEKIPGYEEKLLEALPAELYALPDFTQQKQEHSAGHPLFVQGEEKYKRQGTTTYAGQHKRLHYPVLIQQEQISNANAAALEKQMILAARVTHPLFPKIFDIAVLGSYMTTYQENRGEIFLDDYLRGHSLTEEEILAWAESVIDAMEYLFAQNLAFRDFSSGSMVVCEGGRIGMFRLQNPYYGLVRLQQENKRFYFESEVREIGILLYQLCTRITPVLPFPMIETGVYSKAFLRRVNLLIQKCLSENHQPKYADFAEMKRDLHLKRLSLGDMRFLQVRQTKLRQYESIKAANLSRVFTGGEVSPRNGSLEEAFGFDATVVLQNDQHQTEAAISLLICATGQVTVFDKNEVTIGRSTECDLILTQPSLSRKHARITKDRDGSCYIEDLNTVNGTFLDDANGSQPIPGGSKVLIPKGAVLTLGEVKLQLR